MISALFMLFKWTRPYLSFELIVAFLPLLISLTVWKIRRWILKPAYYSLVHFASLHSTF